MNSAVSESIRGRTNDRREVGVDYNIRNITTGLLSAANIAALEGLDDGILINANGVASCRMISQESRAKEILY